MPKTTNTSIVECLLTFYILNLYQQLLIANKETYTPDQINTINFWYFVKAQFSIIHSFGAFDCTRRSQPGCSTRMKGGYGHFF